MGIPTAIQGQSRRCRRVFDMSGHWAIPDLAVRWPAAGHADAGNPTDGDIAVPAHEHDRLVAQRLRQCFADLAIADHHVGLVGHVADFEDRTPASLNGMTPGEWVCTTEFTSGRAFSCGRGTRVISFSQLGLARAQPVFLVIDLDAAVSTVKLQAMYHNPGFLAVLRVLYQSSM